MWIDELLLGIQITRIAFIKFMSLYLIINYILIQ